MATLTVISWRAIPAQVVAKDGRRTAKALLPMRFQASVDKAATQAGKKDMDEYLAEWRRSERPCGDDLEAEVAAEVARIEAEFPKERLRALVAERGLETAAPIPTSATPSAAAPAASPDAIPPAASPDAIPPAASPAAFPAQPTASPAPDSTEAP